jgi:thermitase
MSLCIFPEKHRLNCKLVTLLQHIPQSQILLLQLKPGMPIYTAGILVSVYIHDIRMKNMAGLRYKAVSIIVTIFFWWGAASAAMPETGNPTEAEHVPDELIVKYRSGSEGRRGELHRRHDSRQLRKLSGHSLERIKVNPGKSLDEAIREFGNDPDVEYAEPNYRVRAFSVPSDPSFSRLWGMNKINAPAAWDSSTGSADVMIAVIDSGIDYNHADLVGNLWVNQAERNGTPGVDDDGNGVVDDIHGYNAITGGGVPFDDSGHGTHVAGTIGAVGNNSIGVAGVNWNVRIMTCKFIDSSGSGSVADAIECLNYVAEMKRRGANIVATNNSWGGSGYSRALRDAIKGQQDILFIAAAGNDATDKDTKASYPANYEAANIISVAATTSSDGLASFSQFGRRSVHVGAPGASIYSTYPGGGYASMSGTSMATPHVAGLAALIKAARPAADWRAIRNLILSGGDPLAVLSSKTVTGNRINAFSSITCLDSRVFSAIRFPQPVQAGTPVTLSALSINCEAPLGPVTVALSRGEVYELKDDGKAPDQVAADGVFTTTITPTRSDESFYFSSPAGSEQVGVAPPDTLITAYPAEISGSSSATFAFEATVAPANFDCSVDGGSFTACTSPHATAPLADGTHTFRVRASNSSGVVDPTPAGLTWTINTADSLMSINAVKTPTRLTSQVISGTVTAGAALSVAVSPAAGVGSLTVNGNNWSCPISGLAEGVNVITIQVIGNDGTVSTKTRSVQVIFPDGRITGSDSVSISDALKALRIAVGIAPPTAEELLHGDVAPLVNGVPSPDDRIDISDALLILRKVVNLASF